MKTFKLKMLKVLINGQLTEIPLLDGLIINRQEDSYPNQWLIEAYTEKEFISIFESLKEIDEVKLQVKITKIENDPVEFRSTIIGINEIGENINILFKADME